MEKSNEVVPTPAPTTETQSDDAMLVDPANVEYQNQDKALEKLTKLHEGCTDVDANSKETKFFFDSNANPILQVKKSDYVLKKFALNQLRRHYGMSPSYFDKIPNSYTEEHLNMHLAAGEKNLIVKLQSDVTVRGVLLDSDNNISNLDVFKTFLDSGVFNDHNIEYFKANQNSMHMRLASKNEAFRASKDDPFHLGLYVYNEEVTPLHFDMGFMLWRLVCSNGAIRTFANQQHFEKGFKTFGINDLRNKLTPAIKYSQKFSNVFQKNLVELKSMTWTEDEWKEYTKQMHKSRWGKGFAEKLMKIFEQNRPENGFKLFNTITNVSQAMSEKARKRFDTAAMMVAFYGVQTLID